MKVPDSAVIQQQVIDQLYRRHQAEVGIQDSQVEDKDVRGRCVTFLCSDLPDDQEVARCPHCQVKHFNAIVENEAIRCPGAKWILVPQWKRAQASGGGRVHVVAGVEHSAVETLMMEGQKSAILTAIKMGAVSQSYLHKMVPLSSSLCAEELQHLIAGNSLGTAETRGSARPEGDLCRRLLDWMLSSKGCV